IGNSYRFYAEGYTPSLVTLLEALDAERLAVAKAYGAQVPGIHQWLLPIWIGNSYRFYAEGYTPSLVTLLEALDAERLAVAKAYGAQVPGIHQWLLSTYGLGGDSLRETFHRLTHEPTGTSPWAPTPPAPQPKDV